MNLRRLAGYIEEGNGPATYADALSEEEERQHNGGFTIAEEQAQLEQEAVDHRGVHLSHCYQGEYEDSCKYGEEDCPARPPINSESQTRVRVRDELERIIRAGAIGCSPRSILDELLDVLCRNVIGRGLGTTPYCYLDEVRKGER